MFFAFSLIEEGATEKVLDLIMPLKSIYNKNLGFNGRESTVNRALEGRIYPG